ncbi:MAG: response regulator [Phycisphaerales bacterium]|nr:response regulator [Phycisphaerales bacterium]
MSNKNAKMNTIRLGQHELHKLLEQYDKDQPDNQFPDREFVRWSFRVESVDLTIEHSTGSKVTLAVATRNISRGGISVLHSAFIHTGSPCVVTLNLPGGKKEFVPGKIVRCNHLQGRVHEIGIAFNEQVSTKDLLGLDPLNEAYSLERVEPDRLHGSTLVVTSTDLDRDLILMFLEDTNLDLSTADTVETALSRAKKGADLILTDFHLEDGSGPELIHALRKEGCEMPVIIMTSDKSETALDAVRDAEAAGILSKPITKDRLLQAFAEFLHADGDGGPLFSELGNDNPAFPLLGKFLTDVTRMALDLEKALRDNDEETCIKICRTLCGTASPLGFPSISEFAIAAETKISTKGCKEASNEIRSLIVACRRIKSKPAA